VPGLSASGALPEMERVRGAALAENLSVPWLGRLWQMLLKGVAEVETAPDRKAAAEMILIRLCHVADMPPPAELIKILQNQPAPSPSVPAAPPHGGGARAVANGAPVQAEAAPSPKKIDFSDVVALAASKRDVMLYAHLRQSAHLVRFAPPVIELRLEPDAPRDFAQRLAALLEAETGRRWTIALSQAEGEPTIAARERSLEAAAKDSAADHPLVRAILETFPGARIETLHAAPEIAETTPEAAPDWGEFAPVDAEPAAIPPEDEEEDP
jgi:DNA polymerase-3 subunit gamma/tau